MVYLCAIQTAQGLLLAGFVPEVISLIPQTVMKIAGMDELSVPRHVTMVWLILKDVPLIAKGCFLEAGYALEEPQLQLHNANYAEMASEKLTKHAMTGMMTQTAVFKQLVLAITRPGSVSTMITITKLPTFANQTVGTQFLPDTKNVMTTLMDLVMAVTTTAKSKTTLNALILLVRSQYVSQPAGMAKGHQRSDVMTGTKMMGMGVRLQDSIV